MMRNDYLLLANTCSCTRSSAKTRTKLKWRQASASPSAPGRHQSSSLSESFQVGWFQCTDHICYTRKDMCCRDAEKGGPFLEATMSWHSCAELESVVLSRSSQALLLNPRDPCPTANVLARGPAAWKTDSEQRIESLSCRIRTNTAWGPHLWDVVNKSKNNNFLYSPRTWIINVCGLISTGKISTTKKSFVYRVLTRLICGCKIC